MKVATWNVNGIRARAAQVGEWLERERPDVVCLQELKAELTQVPEAVRRQDYHAFWHCCKGYSGVSLQLRRDTFPDRAGLRPSSLRSRIPHRHRRGRRPGRRVDLRPERRKGLSRQAPVSHPADRVGTGRSRPTAASCSSAATSTSRAARWTSIRRSGSPRRWDNGRTSATCSRRCSIPVSPTWGGRWIPTTPACSPGGRRGATCGLATSGGGWTTCWRRGCVRRGQELRGAGRRGDQRSRAGGDDDRLTTDRGPNAPTSRRRAAPAASPGSPGSASAWLPSAGTRHTRR